MPTVARRKRLPRLPVQETLRRIGEESVANGTDRLTSKRIDGVIKDARVRRRSRRAEGWGRRPKSLRSEDLSYTTWPHGLN
jgi:hypothetical protein